MQPTSFAAKPSSCSTRPRTAARDVENFNLDVTISVGYRVKSHRGTQFRIRATQRLREYSAKGFTRDDERLKRGGGGNYFGEPHRSPRAPAGRSAPFPLSWAAASIAGPAAAAAGLGHVASRPQSRSRVLSRPPSRSILPAQR